MAHRGARFTVGGFSYGDGVAPEARPLEDSGADLWTELRRERVHHVRNGGVVVHADAGVVGAGAGGERSCERYFDIHEW